VAGPNPYKLHSFREWRAMFGKIYIVCDACRRFTGLSIAEHGQRNTRRTRFTCRRCGGKGRAAPARFRLGSPPARPTGPWTSATTSSNAQLVAT